jgi:hypothetical protein
VILARSQASKWIAAVIAVYLSACKIDKSLVSQPEREQSNTLRDWNRSNEQVEAGKDQCIRPTDTVLVLQDDKEQHLQQCRKHTDKQHKCLCQYNPTQSILSVDIAMLSISPPSRNH